MINERVFRLKKNGELYKYSFCRHPELIENYDKAIADTTQIWECHHRFENLGFTRKQLINMKMYFDVEPKDLVFLTEAEHKALHKKSEETKEKIAATKKGKKRSEEEKAKISASMKGKKRGPYKTKKSIGD